VSVSTGHEPLLRPGEVCQLLGISGPTLRRYANEGLLRPIRYHGTATRRYRRGDVEELLERSREGSSAA
jgi:excisionase family DNA binding protein